MENMENIKNNDNVKKYDIIYSLVVHESPDCVIDLINNIYLCNSSQSVFIVIHCNELMFKSLIPYQNTMKNFILNSTYFNKKLFSKDLTKAHFQNFNFINSSNLIEFKYFCLIASNCLFIKSFKLSDIENNIRPLSNYTQTFSNNLIGWDHHKKTINNINFIKFLKNRNIKLVYNQHEGAIYHKDVFMKIINITKNHKLFKKIKNKIPVEEVLIPILENYVSNGINPRICKVYWERKNYTPNKDDILKNENYMVKRIDRKINDKLRVFIRDKINNELLINN